MKDSVSCRSRSDVPPSPQSRADVSSKWRRELREGSVQQGTLALGSGLKSVVKGAEKPVSHWARNPALTAIIVLLLLWYCDRSWHKSIHPCAGRCKQYLLRAWNGIFS